MALCETCDHDATRNVSSICLCCATHESFGDAMSELRQRAEQAERERDATLEAKAKHEKNANEALEADAATIGTLTKERDEARAKAERLTAGLRKIVKFYDPRWPSAIADIARAALEDK